MKSMLGRRCFFHRTLSVVLSSTLQVKFSPVVSPEEYLEILDKAFVNILNDVFVQLFWNIYFLSSAFVKEWRLNYGEIRFRCWDGWNNFEVGVIIFYRTRSTTN